MLKLSSVHAIGVGVACVLAGCSSPDTTATNAPGAGGDTSATTGKPTQAITLGFSQIGAESNWRKANTTSIEDSAKDSGIKLDFSDAQQKQENQIKAIKSFIAKGVNVIAFSPVVETGWQPVLEEAKRAHIPVIVSDRRPDVPDDLYVTFIGGDFVKEGEMAGKWLAKKMNGQAQIAELTGTVGSAPANDRAKGFRDAIKSFPGMKIVFSQTGNFERAKGKEVMEALLKSDAGKHINALFSHNDDMAIGAIQAIKEAGLKPGKDIVIVSIDGIKDIFDEMVKGESNCTVECNPLLGPDLMDAVKKVVAGKPMDKRIVVLDKMYDQSQAAAELPNRKY